MPTSTPAPTLDFTCPQDNPEGWGTVTPDIYWSMQCGNCAQAPTGTPDPLITPTATLEPTPTAVPTATPINPYLFYLPVNKTYSWTIERYDWDYPWDNYNVPLVELSTILDCGAGNTMYGAIATVETEYAQGVAKLSAFGLGAQDYDVVQPVPAMVRLGSSSNWVAALEQATGLTVTRLETSGSVDDQSTWPPGLWGTVATRSDSYYTGSITYVGIVCMGFQPEITPTPIPTPQPTPDSYCNSVNGAGNPDDLGIQLPEIVVSQAYCLQVGGQTVDLSVLNLIPGIDDLGDLQIPGFNLCYRYISFGNLSLFNFAIDLDILALLIGGVALIRMFVRS